MNKTTFVAVKSALETLGYEARSYSGRGMYGRSCLGIETDRFTSAATVAFRLALQLVEDGEDVAADEVAGMEFSEDSLGLGGIVYLSSLKWEESEEDEDCDEEDCDECA